MEHSLVHIVQDSCSDSLELVSQAFELLTKKGLTSTAQLLAEVLREDKQLSGVLPVGLRNRLRQHLLSVNGRQRGLVGGDWVTTERKRMWEDCVQDEAGVKKLVLKVCVVLRDAPDRERCKTCLRDWQSVTGQFIQFVEVDEPKPAGNDEQMKEEDKRSFQKTILIGGKSEISGKDFSFGGNVRAVCHQRYRGNKDLGGCYSVTIRPPTRPTKPSQETQSKQVAHTGSDFVVASVIVLSSDFTEHELLHELGHALGMMHEFQKHTYAQVFKKCAAAEGKALFSGINYDFLTPETTATQSGAYDAGSCMTMELCYDTDLIKDKKGTTMEQHLSSKSWTFTDNSKPGKPETQTKTCWKWHTKTSRCSVTDGLTILENYGVKDYYESRIDKTNRPGDEFLVDTTVFKIRENSASAKSPKGKGSSPKATKEKSTSPKKVM